MMIVFKNPNRLIFLGMLGLLGAGVLSAQAPAPPDQGAVPEIYRIRCDRPAELESQLRVRLLKDPGFSLVVKPEAEPNVYRIAVLASETGQREVVDTLCRYGTFLPKRGDPSLISIDAGAKPIGPTAYPLPASPYALRTGSPASPTTAIRGDVIRRADGSIVPAAASRQRFVEESRDSFTPTNVPLAQVEQSVRSLLGARLNEMSPGKYLVQIERAGVKKHCTLDVDRENNRLLFVGDKTLCGQLMLLTDAIDRPEPPPGRERRFLSIVHVKSETLARILEINRSPKRLAPLPAPGSGTALPRPADRHPRIEFRHDSLPQTNSTPVPPLVRLVGYQFQGDALGDLGGVDAMDGPPAATETGMEVVTDFRYQILDDLDVLIIDATGAEVARFTDMIRQIEELSKIADPKIEIYPLKHVNCISLNWVIFQIYVDLFRTKQGTVKVIPLIQPNAMLLVGWGHALEAMKDLIETLDQPVAAEHNTLQVISLKHASAQYVLTVLRGTFPAPSMQNSAFMPRVQMYADTRTNSLIVQAGPNDWKEIRRIVEKIDVPGAGPKLQMKTFKLKHTYASDLTQVLTNAIQPGTAGTSDRKLPGLELLLDEKGERLIRSGIMADVRISSDPRTNTVIVTAPEQCLPLIEGLIEMFDTPSATAEIKIFPILYGNATSLVEMLKSLIPTQAEGQVGPQLPGSKDEDALVPIRFAVDNRTNCILAAGTPGDLKIVQALLYSLDREDLQTRKQTVYALKSMMADDVALAINAYLKSKRTIQQAAPGVISPYQQIESEVIVVAEAVSNSLLVSATPRYYDEILQLIKEIDKSPPQVIIQVLIGEVTLSNADEFGAEFGIQDSLLFGRSTFDNIQQGTRTITKTLADGTKTVIEEPMILSGTVNPGWLFNESPTSSLGDGYNSNSASTVGTVGSQLLTNFATGRVGAETGFGGMVFSANSDAVSIMIRALQETNRLEVLSRPQIMAMNNQPALIHVGQEVPRMGSMTSYDTRDNYSINDVPVGLQLMVTPSISPEGNVVMSVFANKSKISSDSTVVGYSNGTPVRSPAIDTITTRTMISAADNETVVLGGLITKEKQELKRKVPLLGDIPVLGKLFSYEYNKCRRSELLVILTPRIVKDACDAEEIKQVEAARMSWCLRDVSRLHGDIGTYNVVADTPYAGDAEVVFPESVDMDALRSLDELPQPTLAPPADKTRQKMPAPVLPKK